MKKFLYLVQAHAEFAEKHLKLRSSRADVLIYTFDRKIDKPGFLYKPNTVWHQGRNILIEAAKKLPRKYSYYVLMDDDIVFRKGNHKGFEEDVLNMKPDLCQPLYYSSWFLKKHSRRTPFPYSEFHDCDCAFVCIGRKLFFDEKLLPYETRCLDNDSLGLGHQYSIWFWIKLFEYYSHKNLIVLNRFQIVNQRHEFKYNLRKTNPYDALFRLGKFRDPNFSNKFYKQVPITKIYSYVHLRMHFNLWRFVRVVKARGLRLPADKRKPGKEVNTAIALQLCKDLWAQKSYKYLISLVMFYLYYQWITKISIYKRWISIRSVLLGLWRDTKLNSQIWLSAFLRKNTTHKPPTD